jgi:hypothetical protein
MTERMSPKSVWKLDQLRHTDPKTARRMTRGGNGSRTKQYAALTAMEDNPMAQVVIEANKPKRRTFGTARQLNTSMSEELHNRFIAMQGTMPRVTFLAALLDAYEQRQAKPVSTSPITAEAANILAAFQQKHNLPSQLEAVRRLVDAHALLANRIAKVTEHERTIQAMRADILRIERERNTVQEEMRQMREVATITPTIASPVVPVREVKSEAESVLLDFTDAFAGATMTADPSGEVVVAIVPGQLTKMFPIWQRAVRVLGISKREAA